MAICFDQFIITVVGGIVECDVTIDTSNFDPPTYSAPVESNIVVVPFSYEIGAPPRTKFATEYIKSRTGGTGTPPSIISRVFRDPAPEQGQAANSPVNNELRVTTPVYDQAQANMLGAGGFDTHSIKIIIAEASDIVGN